MKDGSLDNTLSGLLDLLIPQATFLGTPWNALSDIGIERLFRMVETGFTYRLGF